MFYQMSCIGRHHSFLGEENQDVVLTAENHRYEVITLADGVTTCKESKKGAEIASKTVTDLLLKNAPQVFALDSDQIIEIIIMQVLYELEQKAETDHRSVDDYSSTISSVLADKKRNRMLYFHLGDGIIIASENERCRVIAMPDDNSRGCW